MIVIREKEGGRSKPFKGDNDRATYDYITVRPCRYIDVYIYCIAIIYINTEMYLQW